MNSNGDRKKGGVKVLHVSTHMNIGGIGNYILSLSRATKARGIDVAVASSGGDLVVELEKSGIRHYGIDIRTKSELSPKVVKSVFALAKLIEKEGVDIVHAHTRVSQVAVFFASRMSGVPYISTCHGFFKTRFRKIFDTWGARAIAISDAVADHLRDDQGVSAERVEVIYSGIDAARFAREYSADEINGIKRSLGLRPGPVVGSIGRLSPVKGQRFLIEAMRGIVSEIGDAQALIVGNGPDEKSLKELARSLGLQDSICFTDAGLDTHKYLSAMDIFVFPSVKEGLGIALLEALASGRGCVASGVGGIANIIKDGSSGILVPVGDADAISRSVLRLLKDAGLRNSMGKRGRELVRERFLLDDMAGNIIELYKEVLEGRYGK